MVGALLLHSAATTASSHLSHMPIIWVHASSYICSLVIERSFYEQEICILLVQGDRWELEIFLTGSTTLVAVGDWSFLFGIWRHFSFSQQCMIEHQIRICCTKHMFPRRVKFYVLRTSHGISDCNLW